METSELSHYLHYQIDQIDLFTIELKFNNFFLYTSYIERYNICINVNNLSFDDPLDFPKNHQYNNDLNKIRD